MKRYCEKCKKVTEWKEGFLLDLLRRRRIQRGARMTKGQLLKEFEGLDDDAQIYIETPDSNVCFHVRYTKDKTTGADVENEITLVCE